MKHVLLALIVVGCSSGTHTQTTATATETTSGSSEAEATRAPVADAPTEPTADPAPEETPTPTAPPTSADELTSADIPNPCAPGLVRLREGGGEYPSTIGMDTPGSLELQPIATGDLDGDGRDEMLAHVLCEPGGSGTVDSIRAYHVDDGVVVEVAVIEGGDRADGGLDVAHVVNRDVVVGRFSGNETMCCPTHVTAETWQLRGGHFVRTHVGARRPVEH